MVLICGLRPPSGVAVPRRLDAATTSGTSNTLASMLAKRSAAEQARKEAEEAAAKAASLLVGAVAEEHERARQAAEMAAKEAALAAEAIAANGGVDDVETSPGTTGVAGPYSQRRVSVSAMRPCLDRIRRDTPVPVLFCIHLYFRLLAVPAVLAMDQLWVAVGLWLVLIVLSGLLRPMRWVEDSFVLMAADVELIIVVALRPFEQVFVATRPDHGH